MRVSHARNEDGSDEMRRRRTKRDTYLYELKDRGKVVYRGITNDIERRISEHERARKRFTTYCYEAVPLSRKSARKREKKLVETYKKGHLGRKPRYNKVL